jgi:O-antigen/teichoic acid export membrane protein
MATPATRRDIIWGYVAQALNIGAGLILLPVILHFLPPEDVGLWFVFVTLGSLAQLLEFGFQPTMARNTAYVYAGAQVLVRKGLSSSPENPCLNLQLLSDLVHTARGIYRIVSLLAFVALIGGGTFYISQLLVPTQDPWLYLSAWITFAFGYVATFYYGYFNGLLQGRGDITSANKVIVITRGTFILLGAVLVVLGYGLIGLGIASLISAIIGRWASRRYYFTVFRPEARQAHYLKVTGGKRLLSTLWHNSWRLGMVHLGAFLIQRASILIASSFLGLAAAASYGMTITVLMALMSIATVLANVQLPHMNALQLAGDRQALRAIFGEILIVAWIAFLSGLGFLLLYGDDLLILISSRTPLLPVPELMVLGVIMLLELNHSVAASYITTTNEVPFLKAALFSGLIIVLLSLALVSSCGVWGLILAQGVVQLAYNNWKWPKDAIAHLGGNFSGVLWTGFISLKSHVVKA